VASLWRSLKDLFSPGATVSQAGGSGALVGATVVSAPTQSVAVVEAPPVEAPPFRRKVIQAPVLSDPGMPAKSDEILIKAQPALAGDQCTFRVNRPLFAGFSWYFPNFESAESSALAESLFSVDGVETVLVHEASLIVTRKDKNFGDWRPMALEVGKAIRACFQAGRGLIAEKIVKEMPTEERIRTELQRVIDFEINPGVAGHGGKISLLGLRGNTVTIQMGGGCQGCSSADVTLKMGIHSTFRRAAPYVGAIYDETDHAAGLNPYF
jgi:Fe-S cluster biogenesis protein NfuA